VPVEPVELELLPLVSFELVLLELALVALLVAWRWCCLWVAALAAPGIASAAAPSEPTSRPTIRCLM
jgi:hypothetical protein